MRQKTISLFLIFVFLFAMAASSDRVPVRVSASGPDLYIADTTSDTGVEPNPDSGPMYVSNDIWVRTEPDPAYHPQPFADPGYPSSAHTAHQNPEYRDPKYSRPNYVYVRVHNRGDAASSGTEKLRIFWAKASTGLGWPTQWGGGPWAQEVDYSASVCGPTKLYGQEVTKPRKNAANATTAERNAYRDAILGIGTTAGLVFPGGTSYWHKQQEVHTDPAYTRKHSTPLFIPWHREFINRYEVLLQEQNPSVKLLYWDWVTNPQTGSFNFMTSAFMGASGSGSTTPTSVGAPFNPSSPPTLAPPAVSRAMGSYVAVVPGPDIPINAPTSTSNTTILNKTNYADAGDLNANGQIDSNEMGFESFMENFGHNWSHVFIGGGVDGGVVGNMTDISVSAQDPFFFLLHANADRLWARWQRNATHLGRLEPATTYDTDTANVNITDTMEPWNGHAGFTATGSIRPWRASDGYVIDKTGADISVVSPPIYDDAPLVIPALQPGESVIMQIPWYPPNPADYSGNGCNQGHFCLLSRIETSTAAPFGMTTPEVMDVGLNTKNNNNIAWKNLHVADDFTGAFKMSSIIMRNIFRKPVMAGLRFADIKGADDSFFKYGRVVVTLPPELLKRWLEKNGDDVDDFRGLKVSRDEKGNGKLEISSPEALIKNIELAPGEAFPVGVQFELFRDYKIERQTILKWDLIQTGTPDDKNAVVGGQRFEIDLSQLTLVKKGSQWRYFSSGASPGDKWTSPDFDDSRWRTGEAELGFGDDPMTTIDGGPVNKRFITSYYRNTFEVSDPGLIRDMILRLKRDDGAVVYLNGTEINRVNLPKGAITAKTLATREVKGIEEEVFFPIKVDPKLLREGRNVVAVELHQISPRTEDASFDLELSANNVSPRFAPNVAFASLVNGSLWQKGQVIPLSAEALDGDGKVRSVSFFVDGRPAGTLDQAPFKFELKDLATGVHRVKVVAIDDDGQEAVQELTITVLDNTPPIARLTQPANGAVFMPDVMFKAGAQASDPGGKIARVDFYLKAMKSFMARTELVGSATKAPYIINVKGLSRGHYMLWAVAVDDLGSTSQSVPVHISIGMDNH